MRLKCIMTIQKKDIVGREVELMTLLNSLGLEGRKVVNIQHEVDLNSQLIRFVIEHEPAHHDAKDLPVEWELDVRRGRQNSSPWVHSNTVVKLDGLLVERCVAADRRFGCVAVFKTDHQGRVVMRSGSATDPELHVPTSDGNGYFLVEIHYGVVEIIENDVTSMPNLKYRYDRDTDTMEIEGSKYSGQFFRDLGRNGLGVGSIVEIVDRKEDGAVFTRRRDLEELRDGVRRGFRALTEMTAEEPDVAAVDLAPYQLYRDGLLNRNDTAVQLLCAIKRPEHIDQIKEAVVDDIWSEIYILLHALNLRDGLHFFGQYGGSRLPDEAIASIAAWRRTGGKS